MTELAKIKLIYTGGTIGGESKSGELLDSDLQVKKFFDELEDKESFSLPISDFIDKTNVSTPVKEFSENFVPDDWVEIAKVVKKSIEENRFDAIIILHGTDTMAYTSAALSFFIQGVKMPVILTGANLPITHKNTDSIRNVEDAITLVIKKKEELKGIFLSFAGSNKGKSFVHLGNRCRKISADINSKNFESVNVRPIAKVTSSDFLGKRIEIMNKQLLKQVSKKNAKKALELYDRICSNVRIIKLYPGFNPETEIYNIRQYNIEGIILEVYVSGTACIRNGKYSLIPFLKELRNRKIPVFMVSEEKGNIVTDIYGSSGKLVDNGVCPLGDMITEAAYTKLCWVLGHEKNYEKVIEVMKKNIAGEITSEKA